MTSVQVSILNFNGTPEHHLYHRGAEILQFIDFQHNLLGYRKSLDRRENRITDFHPMRLANRRSTFLILFAKLNVQPTPALRAVNGWCWTHAEVKFTYYTCFKEKNNQSRKADIQFPYFHTKALCMVIQVSKLISVRVLWKWSVYVFFHSTVTLINLFSSR